MTQLLTMLNDVNLIDIRPILNFNNNHIPSAKNIPQSKLIITPDKYLKKSETYYIYCQKGINSIGLAQMLNKQGYNIINVEGGYEKWVLTN
ncbi:MAG: rhodanese-like domain-containing protein [Bacilli bacterium]